MFKRILVLDTVKKIGKEVFIQGWIERCRDLGKMSFLTLKDRSGIIQVIFEHKGIKKDLLKKIKHLKPQSVVGIKGIVRTRPKDQVKKDSPLGCIEIKGLDLKIYSLAKVLPFPVEKDGREIKEDLRFKYRYLDLRRKRLKENLKKRQEIIHFIRSFLIKKEFVEIETPILTKSTPEGARDFLVPSRNFKGKFYALPQAPQQYKQLLMVAGFERYFQIARCFRDEDLRGDRQPEFTQLDLEMSFVSQEDVLKLVEELLKELVTKLFPSKKILKFPFPRLTYSQAISQYKTDKPDLREDKKDKNILAFTFIVEFPLFEFSEEEKRLKPVHNPFTAPYEEDLKLLRKDPLKVRAHQYDLVLNGKEIGGGALRIYQSQLLLEIFKILGYSSEEIKEKFGHLLSAFEYGAPPHGGIALGLDRLISLLLDEPNIREVIAFPKTSDARDLMMNAPCKVEKKQLKELGISIKK